MSWNPMMGPAGAMADPMQGLAQALSQYKPNQLGAGVTLGNPQAQEDYVAQLARALADSGAAGDLMDRANALKDSGWIDNSGLAGVAERMFSGWAGKKMSEKARNQQADAEQRKMTAESVLEEAKAARAAAREQRKFQDDRAQRIRDADEFGLTGRARQEYVLTGKMSAEQRDRMQGMMTNQGFVAGNLDDGTYRVLRPEGQQAPPNVNIDQSIPPEIRQAIIAHEQSGQPIPDELNVTGRQQGPLMPYQDPAIAQRQAAQDAREDAKLGLAYRAADMADEAARAAAEARRQEAEAKAQGPASALAMWAEARAGLESALGKTETGYFAGRLPTITAAQQTAEGAVAATAPILKQIFRTSGEGTFTDKDQELLLRMVPTRTDEPEARADKIANIDRIIRAKLGGAGSAPQADDDRAPTQRIRIKL